MSPLLEAAKSIGEPPTDDDEQAAKPADNGNGSFERFMMSFGSPGRWAGR